MLATIHSYSSRGIPPSTNRTEPNPRKQNETQKQPKTNQHPDTMAKRKGSEYAAAPPTAVVAPSRSATSFAAGQAAGWDSTRRIIQDLIAEYEASDAAGAAGRCLSLGKELEGRKGETVEAADAAGEELRRQLKEASLAASAAAGDLEAHSAHLAGLEGEAAELRRRSDLLAARTREAEARAASHRAEAEARAGEAGAVRARRMEEVPKIQMQIALYAKVLGIKWDYDGSVGGKLKGEVVSGGGSRRLQRQRRCPKGGDPDGRNGQLLRPQGHVPHHVFSFFPSFPPLLSHPPRPSPPRTCAGSSSSTATNTTNSRSPTRSGTSWPGSHLPSRRTEDRGWGRNRIVTGR